MKKVMLSLIGLLVISVSSAYAEGFSCPSPDQVKCVPAVTTLGNWKHNGGQMTGNAFSPNNQCANTITLANGETRLMCCYTKCGVFFMDVPHRKCKKLSEARFLCE